MHKYTINLGLHGDGQVFHLTTGTAGYYAGNITVGPIAFLNFLELHLGLSGHFPTNPERLVNLKNKLDKVKDDKHFLFKDAYNNDPLGVAQRLLNLWDSFRLSGWTLAEGKPFPQRMAMLYHFRDIFTEIGIGLADRWESLVASLKTNTRLPLLEITLLDSLNLFDYPVQQALGILQQSVKITESETKPQARQNTDLLKLQKLVSGERINDIERQLSNDGTLQLLYFPDEIQATSALFTLMCKNNWKPLLVNSDNGLLNGLAKAYGKPACNWDSSGGNGQIIQLFFLATAFFKRPLNTSQVQGFLSSAQTPFSRKLAYELLEIFAEKPGIQNKEWNEKITEYLNEIKDTPKEQENVRKVKFWLQNDKCLEDEAYDTDLLKQIYTRLATWAKQRVGLNNENWITALQFNQLAQLCNDMINALQGEEAQIRAAKFERLQTRIFTEIGFAIMEAESGSLNVIPEPGGIWCAEKEVVWMNASRSDTGTALSKYWYTIEKEYLKTLGLSIPDESITYQQFLSGLKRMVLSVQDRLVIIISKKQKGSPSYKPYCIDEWNEFLDLQKVSIEVKDLLTQCPWAKADSLLATQEPISLPVPQAYIAVPENKYQREEESYSGLERLFQHPVEWFFNYSLNLRHKGGLSVPDMDSLLGTVADTLVQRLFTIENTKAECWDKDDLFCTILENQFEKILNEQGSPLLEKINKRPLFEFKNSLKENLRKLKQLIQLNGFSLIGTQNKCTGVLNGQKISGYIDLLLEKDGKLFIIDLKWTRSKKSYHERLQTGRDLQLAIYRNLKPTANGSAYFLLNNGTLLLREEPASCILKGNVEKITGEEGVSTSSIIKKAANSIAYRMNEINSGKIEIAYHDEIENLELDYTRDEITQNLYPIDLVNGLKKTAYSTDLNLILGNIK